MEEHRGIRESAYPMTPVPECVFKVLTNTQVIPKHSSLRINEAANRVVFENIYAPFDIPRQNTSIMDGYAVNSQDPTFSNNCTIVKSDSFDENGVLFEVTQLHTAGPSSTSSSSSSSNDSIVNGQAAYITTGSVLPNGTDSVIKVEDSSLEKTDKNHVRFHTFPSVTGIFVRGPGSDMKKGELILSQGTVIHSSEIGLLAMCGISKIAVYSRPKVTVLSTGDELIDALTQPKQKDNISRKGMIYDSNRPMLLELINEFDFQVTCIDGKIMGDNLENLEKYILKLLLDCDILITSGGVSMGSRDYMKPILENLCKKCNQFVETKTDDDDDSNNDSNNEASKVHFGRMLMKPGKPTTFATLKLNEKLFENKIESARDIDSLKLIFGLPGNPVSCNVTFKLLIDACIKKMAGLPKIKWQLPPVTVELSQSIKMDAVRPEYHRATIYWDKFKARYIAYSTGFQRSSRLLSMLNANCLLRIPQKSGILEKGSLVKGLIIDAMIPDMPPKIDENTGQMVIQQGCNCEGGHKHGHHHHHDHNHTHDHKKKHDHNHDHSSHAHNVKSKDPIAMNVAILTVSDRASNGIYEDKSGPVVESILKKEFTGDDNKDSSVNYNLIETKIIKDNKNEIKTTLLQWCKANDNKNSVNLILTLGGTGFGKRDVTPEATKEILEKETPGIVYAMFAESFKKTPFAALSRYTAGIVGNTLIVNMPGSPKAVTECLQAIIGVLPHALAELQRSNA